MAHKKAGGSTRNGRDSESNALVLKFSVAKQSIQVASSFVSVALSSTRATMSVSAKTTHCSQLPKALYSSCRKARKTVSMQKWFPRRLLPLPVKKAPTWGFFYARDLTLIAHAMTHSNSNCKLTL